MKKAFLILMTVFALFATGKAQTQYFEAVNADGDTIRYATLSASEAGEARVEVILRTEYSGDIVIPSSVEYNGTTYSVTQIGTAAFYACEGLNSVTLPNTVTTIASFAFMDCGGLTSVILPNTVANIGNSAFSNCTALTSLDLGSSLTRIESLTFENCSALSSIRIPNSVERIDYSAFYGCSSLTAVSIPASVKSMSADAFWACTALEQINIDAANPVYSSVEGIWYNKNQDTLIICPEGRVGSVNIPNTVTHISNSAFGTCVGLTDISIPNSVTKIDTLAFYGCSGISSISIPSSVNWIMNGAFMSCTNLDSVNCFATLPPQLEVCQGGNEYCYGVFEDIANGAVLTVPCSALEAYQNSAWADYFGDMECTNVGLEETRGGFALTIELFPNPAESFVTVKSDNLASNAELILSDLQGRTMIQRTIDADEREMKLNLENLASGTYFVRITSQEGTGVHKLVKP